MSLSFDEVAEILKVIDASDVEELVLEIGELRLVVRRGGAGQAAGAQAPAAATPAAPVTTPPASPAALPGSPPAAPVAPPEAGAEAVEAPSVGRAYRRPAPEEAPFVEEGQRVEAGQTVCLLEVMKLFATVAAPISGTVIGFGFEDGGAVEYGAPLVWIRPD